MKNSQKGSAALILIIIAVLVIAGGLYVYSTNKHSQEDTASTNALSTSTNSTTTLAGWKTYTNTQYGFSVQYPPVGDILDKGKDANGVETIIVGLQSNSADVQDSFKITIQKAQSADECSEGYVRGLGVDFKEFSINGVTFLKADLSSLYNKGKAGSVFVDDYCNIHNNYTYRLTTSATVADVKGLVYSYSDFEKDDLLNNAVASFKFTSTTSSTQEPMFSFPTSNATLKIGQTYKLAWKYPKNISEDVSIYLFGDNLSPTNGLAVGHVAGPNYSFSWKVPNELVPSGKYYFVMSGNSYPKVQSPVFSIVK